MPVVEKLKGIAGTATKNAAENHPAPKKSETVLKIFSPGLTSPQTEDSLFENGELRENQIKAYIAKIDAMSSLADWSYEEWLDPRRKARNEYYKEEGGCDPNLRDRFLRAKFSDGLNVVIEFCPDKFQIGKPHDAEWINPKTGLPAFSLVSPETANDYAVYLEDSAGAREPITTGEKARELYWKVFEANYNGLKDKLDLLIPYRKPRF